MKTAIAMPVRTSTRRAAELPPKDWLGEVAYSRGAFEEFYQLIGGWLLGERSENLTISYVNPHVFNLAQRHASLRAFLGQADLVTVDGLGIALGARLINGRRQTRTVMTPLFDQVLATPHLPRLTAALIGGSAPVVANGAAAINRASPWLKVRKVHHGYAALAESMEFLRAEPETDLVLVAMGSPRSEEFIQEAAGHFSGKLFWNIGGGTLHFYAGTLRRVPPWVSRLGVQWLWRICHEPAIAPRYFVGIPVFLSSLARLFLSRSNP
ncbi:MAG TPA: WecB/TagA/CpsF family glycosyltransferase [Verrucomicrobiae bacterium]|jgi:N-acetylglucosaminyldiphosphoundecaprenol N-acetyl-beta-D-mannosaminyltransferase|nr:WecB/TagA/CpsF family glycosyltransferase [Verrucomicrobiae bacterium]